MSAAIQHCIQFRKNAVPPTVLEEPGTEKPKSYHYIQILLQKDTWDNSMMENSSIGCCNMENCSRGN